MGPKKGKQSNAVSSSDSRQTQLTGMQVLQSLENRKAHNAFYAVRMSQIEFDAQWSRNMPNILRRTQHYLAQIGTIPTVVTQSEVLMIRMRVQSQLETEGLVYLFFYSDSRVSCRSQRVIRLRE